jgi:hypothetical protein
MMSQLTPKTKPQPLNLRLMKLSANTLTLTIANGKMTKSHFTSAVLED